MSIRRKRILIVEDDFSMKTILTRVLFSLDEKLNVSWCPAADEALSELSGTRSIAGREYDLIIVDIYTPGTSNGYDVWKMCSQKFPNTPVLITSGISVLEFLDGVPSESVAPPFLHKPLAIKQCREVIQSLLVKTGEKIEA